jgi:hypothetical protein
MTAHRELDQDGRLGLTPEQAVPADGPLELDELLEGASVVVASPQAEERQLTFEDEADPVGPGMAFGLRVGNHPVDLAAEHVEEEMFVILDADVFEEKERRQSARLAGDLAVPGECIEEHDKVWDSQGEAAGDLHAQVYPIRSSPAFAHPLRNGRQAVVGWQQAGELHAQ